MIIKCFLFTVMSKVVFTDDSCEIIPMHVYAKSEGQAMLITKNHLESGKSGFKVKEVVGQRLGVSSCFLIDDKDKVISFDEMFPS